MKSLITGIDGFVGPYLAQLLKGKGYVVVGTALDKNTVTDTQNLDFLYSLDITDYVKIEEILTKHKPDFIFHLAAQSSAKLSWNEPSLTININTIGTINLLNAIKNNSNKSKVLLIGSSEEYGDIGKTHGAIDELYRLNPQNPYAVSKISQTFLGEIYAKAYNLDIFMTRAFNHFGPKQESSFVIADFCKKIAYIEKSSSNSISVGNLSAYRDFTDVRDIVQAYYDVITLGIAGEIYNVGSGHAISIQNILDILLSFSKKKINVEIDKSKLRPLDVPFIECNNYKLKKQTGWEPKRSLENSLLETLNYWRNEINN